MYYLCNLSVNLKLFQNVKVCFKKSVDTEKVKSTKILQAYIYIGGGEGKIWRMKASPTEGPGLAQVLSASESLKENVCRGLPTNAASKSLWPPGKCSLPGVCWIPLSDPCHHKHSQSFPALQSPTPKEVMLAFKIPRNVCISTPLILPSEKVKPDSSHHSPEVMLTTDPSQDTPTVTYQSEPTHLHTWLHLTQLFLFSKIKLMQNVSKMHKVNIFSITMPLAPKVL